MYIVVGIPKDVAFVGGLKSTSFECWTWTRSSWRNEVRRVVVDESARLALGPSLRLANGASALCRPERRTSSDHLNTTQHYLNLQLHSHNGQNFYGNTIL